MYLVTKTWLLATFSNMTTAIFDNSVHYTAVTTV